MLVSYKLVHIFLKIKDIVKKEIIVRITKWKKNSCYIITVQVQSNKTIIKAQYIRIR